MRKFELTQGGSHKFWEIDCEGASLTVRFGRVGAAGQTQVKKLPSREAATKALDKLVTEKLAKGYVELKPTSKKAAQKTRGAEARVVSGAAHSTSGAVAVAVEWVPDGSRFVTLHANGDLVVWSETTSAATKVIPTREAGASCLALVENGAQAIVGATKRATLWDLATGKLLTELGKTGSPITRVVSVSAGKAWRGKENHARAVGSDASGNLALFLLDGGRDRIRQEHKAAVTGLVAMPGGAQTLSAGMDGRLRLHDVDRGHLATGFDDAPNEHAAVVVLPDAKRAATATGKRVVVWNLRGLDVAPGDVAVKMMASVPGSERVVTASADGSLRVWDATTGRIEREVSHHPGAIECLGAMPEGDVVITSSADGAFVSWSAKTGEIVCKREEEPDTRPGAIFPQRGGKVLWHGQDDTWLHVWDARTGDASDLEREDQNDDDAEQGDIDAAILTPDSRTVVGTDGHRVAVWDLAVNGTAKEHKLGGYGSATITPNGRLVLKTPAEDFDEDYGKLGVWDVKSGKRIRQIGVGAGYFDPSCQRFARQSPGQIEVWDVESGKVLGTLEGGHPGRIHAIVWSPDGSLIATTSTDADRKKDDRRPPWERTGVVCLWDVETQKRIGRWEAPAVIKTIAITPGGRLVVGLYDGDVAFFSAAG